MKLGWLGITVVLLLGSIVGTVLGQIIGILIPSGPVHDLFFKGVSVGLKEPLQLDLSALQLVFGLTLSVNPLTLVGLLLAIWLVIRFK